MSQDDNRHAGFFGKVPTHGDFVSRRLPRSFVDPWDRWLQGSIASSREQLADEWLDIYLTSPIWRFVLSPGICGETCWAGVLMPSVDRVGRYYPLTLGYGMQAGVNPLQIVNGSDNWFQQSEELLLTCLEDDFNLDAFDKQVLGLGSPIDCNPESQIPSTDSVRHQAGGSAWRLAMPNPNALRTLYPDLARQLLKELFFAYSLWWTSGSNRIEASLLICQGLPPLDGFSALLSGTWQERGWQEKTLGPTPSPVS